MPTGAGGAPYHPDHLVSISIDVRCEHARRVERRTAIRTLESGGDYTVKAQLASASGAYQIIDSTWASWSRDAGVGTEYRHASDAPPAVQDAVAAHRVTQILDSYHDVSVIPLIWYYPAVLNNPALLDIIPAPEAGNRLTPRQYQTRWMTLYTSKLPGGPTAVCDWSGGAPKQPSTLANSHESSSPTTATSTVSTASSPPAVSKPSTTRGTEPNIKSQHPPGPGAKGGPVHVASDRAR